MVERHLAKVNVASSNLVFRSNLIRKNEVFCLIFSFRRDIYAQRQRFKAYRAYHHDNRPHRRHYVSRKFNFPRHWPPRFSDICVYDCRGLPLHSQPYSLHINRLSLRFILPSRLSYRHGQHRAVYSHNLHIFNSNHLLFRSRRKGQAVYSRHALPYSLCLFCRRKAALPSPLDRFFD